MMSEKKPRSAKVWNPEAAVIIRKALRLNQIQFWGQIGVTQSGGSRYEAGRRLPKPVQLLLEITYGSEPASNELISYLRRNKQNMQKP